jgi:hypothetical protein
VISKDRDLELPSLGNGATWRIFLIGVLARLLSMPFAAHSDLMHMYWSAHLVAYHQKSTLGLQMLLRYFHAGYLRLITPFLPPVDTLWLHNTQDIFLNPFLSGRVVSPQGWFDFINHPQIYRALLLLKLPYLFFDLACAFLLYRLGSDKAKSSRMLAFWWLNPILIFAVYVFGRHDVVALFFVLLSLYLLKKDKYTWGLLALGCAIALRYYPMLLLPFYLISLRPGWKKGLQWMGTALAVWLMINLVAWSLGNSIEIKNLFNLAHNNYLLAMKFSIASWDNIYIFPLLYFLLVLHSLYNIQAHRLRSLRQYSLMALLLLFATAYSGQSPHYWTWFLPFLTLEVVEDQRLLPLHIAQVLCLLVYSFIGGRSTAGYLVASISPDFFGSLPSPVEIIEQFASPEMVISLARTAFSAITLWMAYLVFQKLNPLSRKTALKRS